MGKNVDRLVLQYSKLTELEKAEFRRKIGELDSKNLVHERREYAEKLEKSLGPLNSNICNCCGR